MLHQKVQVWITACFEGRWYVLLGKVIRKRGSGWHPITGSVEPVEAKALNFLGAARREVREETGLDTRRGKWKDLKLKFKFVGRFGPAQERVFWWNLGAVKGFPKVVHDPSEHTALEWVEFSRAEQRIQFEAQQGALAQVSCYLDDQDERRVQRS